MTTADILTYILSPALIILWYLLKQKDDKQAGEIKVLFAKHDSDAEELKQLRLQIAENHYKRQELDTRFDKLETTIKSSFETLGKQFDKLSEMLVQHVTHENSSNSNHNRRQGD